VGHFVIGERFHVRELLVATLTRVHHPQSNVLVSVRVGVLLLQVSVQHFFVDEDSAAGDAKVGVQFGRESNVLCKLVNAFENDTAVVAAQSFVALSVRLQFVFRRELQFADGTLDVFHLGCFGHYVSFLVRVECKESVESSAALGAMVISRCPGKRGCGFRCQGEFSRLFASAHVTIDVFHAGKHILAPLALVEHLTFGCC